jgi:hypothetical protein
MFGGTLCAQLVGIQTRLELPASKVYCVPDFCSKNKKKQKKKKRYRADIAWRMP